MLKTPTIVACVLALSATAALAQPTWVPPGPNNAPGGAGGAATARDIGSPSANVNATYGGQTQSTTILSQSNKMQSQSGMPSSNYGQPMPSGGYSAQAQMGQMDNQNPNAVCITDEYGYKYNCRGDRIGRGRR